MVHFSALEEHTQYIVLYCRGSGFTLALWIKLETECSQPFAIASTDSKASLVYQSGMLQFRFRRFTRKWNLVVEGVVVGRWHHVTVTWSESAGLSLYIDATLANRCDAVRRISVALLL